jgi:hypothetical protein
MKIPQVTPDWETGIFIGNGTIATKRGNKMLHNQHVIDSLNVMCDERIKELDSDSPHGDYIYYSFQDLINREKWEVTS